MDELQSRNVFYALKSIMEAYSTKLDCTEDSVGSYNLFTRYIQDNGKAIYFGGVKINKNFVSYHLMPIYVFPEIVASMDISLKKRLKGKSCFNFKTLNESEIKELASLTKTGFKKYLAAGYV